VVKDNGPTPDRGQSRDIIAEKVDIGSGRTYERARVAIDKIDELHGLRISDNLLKSTLINLDKFFCTSMINFT
jgi:hypothetical protein